MKGFRWLLPFVAGGAVLVAAQAGPQVTPADTKKVVGLIQYLYAGYENGANDRKSFFETVPWDIDTGNLIAKIEKCQAHADGVLSHFDFDWPSASQDPQIVNLKVTYQGSPKPGIATVRASFGPAKQTITVDYDLKLYDDAPLPRRWGVSNIRIHSKELQNPDLLKAIRTELADECKAYNK